MKPSIALRALLLAGLPVLLAACGNKGPLVMPPAAPAEPEVRASPGGVPVQYEAPVATPPAVFDPFDPPIDPATVPVGEPAEPPADADVEVDVEADAGDGND